MCFPDMLTLNWHWRQKSGEHNNPMYYVSWDDVQEFIRKLNAASGKNYRLPTEAEWEYAARGGVQSQGYKYSGSNNPIDVAWYSDNSAHPVGGKSPNEPGIYDMSGKQNPTGASSGAFRVDRGGSWRYFTWNARISNRENDPPTLRTDNLGFRIACSSK